MKKNCLLIFLLFVVSTSFTQNIKGVWQQNTPLFANYESTYQFGDDGSFEYHPAFYNTLQIIYSLNGHYIIKGDSIYFTVNEVVVNDVDLENLRVNKSKNMIPEVELFWVKDGFDNVDALRRDFPSTSNYWSVSYYKRRTIQVNPKTFASSFRYDVDEKYLVLEGHKLNYKYIDIDGDLYYYLYGPSDIED